MFPLRRNGKESYLLIFPRGLPWRFYPFLKAAQGNLWEGGIRFRGNAPAGRGTSPAGAAGRGRLQQAGGWREGWGGIGRRCPAARPGTSPGDRCSCLPGAALSIRYIRYIEITSARRGYSFTESPLLQNCKCTKQTQEASNPFTWPQTPAQQPFMPGHQGEGPKRGGRGS